MSRSVQGINLLLGMREVISKNFSCDPHITVGRDWDRDLKDIARREQVPTRYDYRLIRVLWCLRLQGLKDALRWQPREPPHHPEQTFLRVKWTTSRRAGRTSGKGYREKIVHGSRGFYMDPSPKFLFWRTTRCFPKKTWGHVYLRTTNITVSGLILFADCQTMCAAWPNLRSEITFIWSFSSIRVPYRDAKRTCTDNHSGISRRVRCLMTIA